MKKLFTFLVTGLLTASVFSQSPEKMSYQAIIRKSNEALVTNTQVGMQVSILQGSTSGTAVYVETQSSTTNANGLVSIEIGSGTTDDDFSSIDWADGPYFIKTETDPTGSTNYTISGTSQLLSMPYALHAKVAQTISGTITETDPLFSVSIAAGITSMDTAAWNAASVGSYLETDPVYNSSVASGITATDTTNWNNKLDNETDPIFSAWDKSTDISISESQISDLGTYIEIETDPTFTSSQAASITATDITNLDNLSGINTGDQDLSTFATKTALGDSISLLRSEMPEAADGSETKLSAGTNVSITGTGTSGDPYFINAVTAGTSHYIGELYGGGIIFWISPDGQHGLIASLEDLDGGSGEVWSNITSTSVGTSARSMTDGASNTAAIIAQSGHTNSAAKLCDDYTGGGFTDWYLPSGRELYLLASQDVTIDYILDNDGDAATKGFSQEYNPSIYGRYWSSTEAFNTDSFGYSFTSGYSSSSTKSASFRVRAVRAF